MGSEDRTGRQRGEREASPVAPHGPPATQLDAPAGDRCGGSLNLFINLFVNNLLVVLRPRAGRWPIQHHTKCLKEAGEVISH